MSEEEVKKCPKCDGIMEDGRSLSTDWMIVEMEVSLKKKKALWLRAHCDKSLSRRRAIVC